MNAATMQRGPALRGGTGEEPAILMIDDRQRRKIFGYARAAWEAGGSPGAFDDWRHGQQQLCGVSSLRFAPREMFFKLVQHYMGILREREGDKAPPCGAVRKRAEAGQAGKPAPHGPRRLVCIERCKNPEQMRKIEALLADMGLPWEYADSIAERMFKVRRVEWCDSRGKRGVITALVKRQQKTGGRRTEAKGQRTEDGGRRVAKNPRRICSATAQERRYERICVYGFGRAGGCRTGLWR